MSVKVARNPEVASSSLAWSINYLERTVFFPFVFSGSDLYVLWHNARTTPPKPENPKNDLSWQRPMPRGALAVPSYFALL